MVSKEVPLKSSMRRMDLDLGSPPTINSELSLPVDETGIGSVHEVFEETSSVG